MRTDVAVSGSLLDPLVVKGMRPRIYDWARPDMFSHDQIRALSLIHERFAVGLAGSFPRTLGACHLRYVDQATFGECRAAVGGTAVCAMASADARGASGEGDPEGRRYFVQPGGVDAAFDAAAAERIAREARRLESSSPFSIILFFASAGGAFAPLLAHGDALSGSVLALLRDAWRQRVRVPALAWKTAGEADGILSVPDRVMVLTVGFEVTDNGGKLTMVYPSDHLQKIIHFLG